MAKKRKLKMGMVGGGIGAFIGPVHRMAATLDDEAELVAGAFSSDPDKSKASGRELGLDPSRVYASWAEMAEKESALPDDERVDFVSIVVPNGSHFAAAKALLDAGINVICDKPMTTTLAEAKELKATVKKSGKVLALTHNYTGYPMVKQARHMCSKGILGTINKIVVEYPQGWLSTFIEASGQKQAAWRTDPTKSGVAGSMGDIGSHAENLAEYITGLRITELCADLTTFVEGRKLDDDGNVLLHFDNGAKGILHCSQISVGEENSINIRIYGETGGLEWHQMEPNTLIHKTNDGRRVLRTGVGDLCEAAQVHARVPAGHPEGYLEAFANIYRNFTRTLRSTLNGEEPDPLYADFPDINDGVRGMAFIETVVAASTSNDKWVPFDGK